MVEPEARSSRLAARAHWIVGALGVLAFLASGLDMHLRHDHLAGFDRATRLSFRSIHIYLLFASLLNVAVAPRVAPAARRWAAGAAAVGSLLLLAGPPLLAAAFWREPLEPGLDRNLTRLGVMASAAGLALLTAAQLGRRRSAPEAR